MDWLKDSEFDELRDLFTARTYKKGELVIKEGDTGDSFFMLEQGRLRAWKYIDRDQNEIMHLGRLEPGAYFGEMSLVDHEPRSASITALEDCVLLEMKQETFRETLGKSTNMARFLMSLLSFRVRNSEKHQIDSLVEKNAKLQTFNAVLEDTLRDLQTKQDRLLVNEKAREKLLRDLESANQDLEQKVRERTKELEGSDRENRMLLENMLPVSIVDRLKNQDGGIIVDDLSEVSILFADIVGFTALSQELSARTLVDVLNQLFVTFDIMTGIHGLEKIKTIGDSYMVAGGLPGRDEDDHIKKIIEMAREMLITVDNYELPDGQKLELRIGIHVGPVVAGVIGAHKKSYDIWGDTVNIASRMESHSQPGRIHVSAPLYENLKNQFRFVEREEIEVKGVGVMKTYFLVDEDENG